MSRNEQRYLRNSSYRRGDDERVRSPNNREFSHDLQLNMSPVPVIQNVKDNLYPKVKKPTPLPQFAYLLKMLKELQLECCTENPEEIQYNEKRFSELLRSFYGNIPVHTIHGNIQATMAYDNLFYLYPNLDHQYLGISKFLNNPLNVNYDGILVNPFSVRLDLRFGVMVVLTCYNMLVLDYDVKDFFEEVNPENIRITKKYILRTFRKLTKAAKERLNLPLVWCISETDKGFHLFLVNHYIDSRNVFWSNFLVEMCCDILYAAFSRAQNFSIRLSKKSGRRLDQVANPMEEDLRVKLGVPINPSEYNYIYHDTEDLATVKPDLIKTLKYKYRLIAYFRNFSEKNLEYLKWYIEDREYLGQIRQDITDIWNDLPSIKELTSQLGTNSLVYQNIFQDDIIHNYREKYQRVNKIFLKNFRYQKPLIEEIDYD